MIVNFTFIISARLVVKFQNLKTEKVHHFHEEKRSTYELQIVLRKKNRRLVILK
jgi:hypothetical protein